MSKPENSSKVTIEDLLRLKRAERPAPEFWVNFEQELRQKQLTALVQKRRWWHDVPMLLNRRLYVPAGAAAVVAFSLVTVRYAVPSQVARHPDNATQTVAADPAVEFLPPTVVASGDQDQLGNAEASLASSTTVPLDSEFQAVASNARSESALTASPARPFAVSLARLESSGPDLLTSGLGSRLSAPVREQKAEVHQAELVGPSPASGVTSKYRLIARYADRALSPEPAAPASIRERLARRLGDDLGDGISRVGVVGDRVSLKF